MRMSMQEWVRIPNKSRRAWELDCPYCHARPGDRCVTKGNFPATTHHNERYREVDAYIESAYLAGYVDFEGKPKNG